ncbi:MAG: hypothetical protein OXD31_03000 [Chloroflexi bacterium]|nr:hypothetical protein [Chloroflexota bacterium]
MATREKEGSVTLDKEHAAYEALREELERDRKGDWVIFHDEKLIGIYENFQDAAQDALDKYGLGPYLIKQIGVPVPAVRPFLLYTPVNEDESSP